MTWKNVPIPETIVFPLALGLVVEIFYSKQLFPSGLFWSFIAFGLLVLGLGLIVWSVKEPGKHTLAAPDLLITSGPYSFTRNPMYVAWFSIHLSVFFYNRSLWVLILFLVSVLLTHFFVILKEEKYLREKFGLEFEDYYKEVKRYY